MKKQSLLKSTIIFLVILGLCSIGFLGCVENKTITPAEKDLPANLPSQAKEAISKGVYSLEDYDLAQSLIEDGKIETMKVFPVKFILPEKRFISPKEYSDGVNVNDGKKIAHIKFFETKVGLEETKKNIIYSYSENWLKDFDNNVVATIKGKFCPKLPYQEMTIYKLKCFINGHVRYLAVMNSQIKGKDYFAVFYNSGSPNPKMGDVLAIFLSSLEIL